MSYDILLEHDPLSLLYKVEPHTVTQMNFLKQCWVKATRQNEFNGFILYQVQEQAKPNYIV